VVQGGVRVTKMEVQKKTTQLKTGGRRSETWAKHMDVDGYLDFISGGKDKIASRYADRATHVFIAFQTVALDPKTEYRAVINNSIYNILYVDDPLNMGHHTEMYLENTGGVISG